MKKRAIVLILVGLLCLTGIAYAGVSANYDLSWNVIGGGGGPMDSASYAMRSTVGQIIGLSSSDNYQIGAGYWYGVVSTPTPQIKFNISLVTGYNMISMPLDDSSVTNASSLIDKIGANCTEVLKWDKDTQAWKSYTPGMPPIFDFDTTGGEGYFMKMGGAETVVFTGKGWKSPFTIHLVTGYDAIGIPVNDTSVTKASSLIAKIGTDCKEALKWDKDTQAWKSYTPDMPPIFDFDIVGGDGFFMKMVGPADVTFEGEPW